MGAPGRRGGKEPLSHCRQLSSLRAAHQGRSEGLARLLQSNQYQSRNDNQATRSKKHQSRDYCQSEVSHLPFTSPMRGRLESSLGQLGPRKTPLSIPSPSPSGEISKAKATARAPHASAEICLDSYLSGQITIPVLSRKPQ
ncbi:MAG: hypothetical protein Ct9H90mP26_2410 [Methanobacteriota archaeon]|nr:MAG: hypothetical protein Ct9H90mP26_2410 [Euryarchaeota archaeon]